MKNCLWNPTLRLGAVRTIEGYEKVVDLEELIAFAKEENSKEMTEFVNRTIHEDILTQESNEEDKEDEEDEEDEEEYEDEIEISMEDLKNIVNELIKNPKFRKDVGLDG